jgi:hypothetical protein
MFHKETEIADTVLCLIKVDGNDLAVGFQVLFKEAVVFDASVFIVLQPVRYHVGNHTVTFVLGKEMGRKDEIDMIRFLPEVGAG